MLKIKVLLFFLAMLVPALEANASRPRGPLVVNVGHNKNQSSRMRNRMNTLVKNMHRAPIDHFNNNEIQVKISRNVAGRHVYVTSTQRQQNAVEVFSMFQAIEAARMNRAASVHVLADRKLANRYGEEFLRDMFSGLNVDSLEFVDERTGMKNEKPEALVSFPESKRRKQMRPPLLWSGESHPELLNELAKGLAVEGSVIKAERKNSSNLIRFNLPENPEGRDLFYVQTKRLSDVKTFHEDLIAGLKTIWTANKYDPGRVTYLTPYLPYSRSDRADSPGSSVGAALLPKLWKRAGVDRVLFYSVHQSQEVGIFQALDMPALQAAGEGILAHRIAKQLRSDNVPLHKIIVTAPDAGAEKRAMVFARFLAEELGVESIPVVSASKKRIKNRTETVFTANLKGKVAIAIDDETASGGTMNDLAIEATKNGAEEIYAAVSHLTGKAYNTIDPQKIKKLFVLDTLPQKDTRDSGHPAIEIVGISNFLVDLIGRLHRDLPVDKAMFFEH